jgi:Acyl-CoA dehydrogenases
MADRSYLDWPFFEERHRKLAKELNDWCRQTKWPHHGDSVDATDKACRQRVQLLAEGGWLRWCVPREYGGKHESLDVRSLCLIRETLARYDALADFSFAIQGLGSGAISLYGNSEQKQNILEEVSAGRMIAGFALSEPDAGSDVAAMSSKAFSTTEGWNVNGEKSWISNGGIADYYTFFAKTSDQPGSGGISAFLLKADNPGLSIAERQEVMAPHPLARLQLKDAKLNREALLGGGRKGIRNSNGDPEYLPTHRRGCCSRICKESIGRNSSLQW